MWLASIRHFYYMYVVVLGVTGMYKYVCRESAGVHTHIYTFDYKCIQVYF